jgi:3-hydroxymyristoyl/3-hydroxydecanoyl-(acyl carrier protein) dehydratase
VQPGSLGLEAMAQAVEWLLLHEGLGAALTKPRFVVDGPSSWKYRGQVRPTNRLIQVEVDVVGIDAGQSGVRVVAECALWVDGLKIYQAPDFTVRLIEG